MTPPFLSLPIAGIAFALKQSNLSGQIIVAVLFVGSIGVWSVMITKIREIRAARRWSRRFLDAYRGEDGPLSLLLKGRTYGASPLHVVYEAAGDAVRAALEANGAPLDDLFAATRSEGRAQLTAAQIGVVRSTAERTQAEQGLLIEDSMGLLATATTTAPFLGLLGTVWGVMDSFGGMAMKGSAQLSAVAPGISGALLTTVVGLLVALPSGIGYNTLVGQIRRVAVEMDNFTQELMSDIETRYLA